MEPLQSGVPGISIGFSDAGFTPHGHCYLWDPGLIMLHVAADATIALAYYSIPPVLLLFYLRRRAQGLSWVLLLFALFIFACGTTHLMSIYTLWVPVYWEEGAIKALTALLSIGTAIVLWPLLPRALSIPTPGHLESANAALRQEIERRERVELELRASQQALQLEVGERRVSEDKFRQFMELSPYAKVIADPEGIILLVNSQTLKWFGYDREELIGKPVETLIPERFRMRHPSYMRAYIEAPTLRPMGSGRELYGRRRDGTEFPLDIALSPVQTSEGLQVIASIVDMTEHRRVEGSLKATNMAMGAINVELEVVKRRLEAEVAERTSAEQMFRQFVELAPHAMVIVDTEGKIVLVNSQMVKWFGYLREELLGQPVEALVPERFRKRHPGYVQGYVASPEMRPMGTGRNLYGRRKDGTEFPVDISLSPVRTADGLQVIASIVDMTEWWRVEQELEKAHRTVEATNKELESFAYTVSHDLRAPLRAMTGFAAILMEDYRPQLPQEAQDCLDRIQRASERMGVLIDDILMLSRISRSEIRRERVNLSALAEEVLTELRRTDAVRNIETIVQPHMEAMGDPALLRVLLENLLGNAWKYTGKTQAARIEFGHSAGETPPHFFVRDNGAGFNMAYVDKLFGAFQRLHAVEDFSGTGIGLATAQRIVARHGGRIWARGEEGHGATFSFTL